MSFTTPPEVPAAPSRASPSTFADLGDIFIAWFATFRAWLVVFISELDAAITTMLGYANSASTSAGTATTQAGTATTQAGIATTQAAAAAASAATAAAAPGTNATSATSLTIGTGAKSLTIQTGKSLVVGMSVKIANTASPSNWMAGDITAYNSGTGALDVNVILTNGSGSGVATWTVSLAGATVTDGLQLLSVANITSATATVDFTGLDSTFEEYELRIINAVPVTDASSVWLRTSTDGGSTFAASNSNYIWSLVSGNSAGGFGLTNDNGTTSATRIVLSGAVGNTAAYGGACITVRFANPAGTAHNKTVTWNGGVGGATAASVASGVGQRMATADVDAIRIMFSSGDIATGKFKLYGVKKS
ncbi:MAG: hypothetical protein V4669_13575 [Pseudomonadota bacterium]